LGYEQPIKWIAMKVRERGYFQGSRRSDGQFQKAARLRRFHNLAGRHLEIGAAQSGFYRDLPDARGAEHHFILGVFQNGPSCSGQPCWLDQRPQQDVGVEEQAQLPVLEISQNTIRQRRVEIGWNDRAPRQKTQASLWSLLGRRQWNELRHGLAGFSYDDFLTCCRCIDEP
jgi:hypothetical protein